MSDPDSDEWICFDDAPAIRRGHLVIFRRPTHHRLHHHHHAHTASGCHHWLRHKICMYVGLGGPAGSGAGEGGVAFADSGGGGGGDSGLAGFDGGAAGGSGGGGSDLAAAAWAVADASAYATASAYASSTTYTIVEQNNYWHEHHPDIPATPEPSTWLLLFVGLGALAWKQWRRA